MGFGGAEDTGEEADDTIGYCKGGEFAASEDEITYGEAVSRDLGGYALVDAFVVPTDEYEVGFLGKLFGVGLGEWDSSGVGEDDCGFRGGSAGIYG